MGTKIFESTSTTTTRMRDFFCGIELLKNLELFLIILIEKNQEPLKRLNFKANINGRSMELNIPAEPQ